MGTLQKLDLHSNALTKLPETFANLTAIHRLDISFNSITTDNLSALPVTLTSLYALETLVLDSDQEVIYAKSPTMHIEGREPPRVLWIPMKDVPDRKSAMRLAASPLGKTRASEL